MFCMSLATKWAPRLVFDAGKQGKHAHSTGHPLLENLETGDVLGNLETGNGDRSAQQYWLLDLPSGNFHGLSSDDLTLNDFHLSFLLDNKDFPSVNFIDSLSSDDLTPDDFYLGFPDILDSGDVGNLVDGLSDDYLSFLFNILDSGDVPIAAQL
ncbi:hypothetical protein VKT23_012614 [Stygiomarasmius scandens]|uniref:Uncharacterized protein n=1 Tax=Marasmiellus scandens TaxID=2682957 RepID=A0ABR1J639_9AGAR